MLGQPSLQYSNKMSYFAFRKRFAFYFALYKVMFQGSLPKTFSPTLSLTNALDSAQVAVNVIIAFILAMIATIIGVNLISPVATAVGGALNNKNLTGAANSLTAQITLLFVVVVILGVVIFIAVLGGMASKEAA